MKVGVIITNYNTWPLALRCADMVRRFESSLDEIVLIDDASSDPPPAVVGGRVRLECNVEHLGLARTLNRGVSLLSSDIVVFFDADAYPLGDFAPALHNHFLADPQLAVVGFSTVDDAGSPSGSSEPEPGLLSLLAGQRLHSLLRRIPVLRPSGQLCVALGAMAVRRCSFDALGGFDAAFDFLDVDNDFCMSAWRRGWKVSQASNVTAFHVGGGTPQATSTIGVRFRQNRWRLLKKYDRMNHPHVLRWAILCGLATEFILLSALDLPGAGDALRFADEVQGRRQALSV